MNYTEKTIETKEIFHGKVIKLRVDQVELPNGKIASREIIEHPGGVAVVAVTPEKEVLLVKQFRKPCEVELWELPAGKLDKGGESPEVAAMRELEEETGFRTDSLHKLLDFYTSPGFANEVIHIYYTDQIKPGTQSPDEDEFLSVHRFSWSEIERMLKAGEIRDAKTVSGILLAKELMGADR